MTASVPEGVSGAPRPFSEIPRVGLRGLLRGIFQSGGGRVDMVTGLSRQYDSFGPVVTQIGGPFRFVNLFGADANRLILLDREQIFSAQRPWTRIMGRIFPNGLLLRDGQEHKHHRKIMREAFKSPVLREYGQSMGPMISDGIAGWDRQGEPTLAFPAFKTLTLNLATRIFLGVDLGPSSERMNTAFENMVAASMSRIRLPIRGLEFNRGLQGREFMVGFLSSLIAKKRSAGGPDMFSRLCRAESEDGDRFADQEVFDHMVFLMMAAHDTTTSTLTSMTYELAANPEWQERARDESRALGSLQPSFDELSRMESLSWVMKETLRLYPPLPVIPRVATAAFEFSGYEIPAGAMIVVAPIHTHRMSEWWDEPDRFDPERFSPSRAEDARHTHSWVPFGGGTHMCVGRRFAETQVLGVMHQLLLRYRWSVPEGYVMPVQQAPISKPRDGLPVRFEAIA